MNLINCLNYLFVKLTGQNLQQKFVLFLKGLQFLLVQLKGMNVTRD